MAVLRYKAKNEANLKDKPKVYFTCHPDDFEKHFDKVCDDIFKTHDCIIYYTEDMTSIISDQDKAVDIGSNNLVVIPVTKKLLSTPNRAMNEDFVYALTEHIPIIPIMMEPGIDQLYAQPNKFGTLQYLTPFGNDATAISYEDKLDKFLSLTLISNDLANRVRAAFDAYIFLSYRKKDRNYANQLMRLIHSHPECRDIAIWYDEFLTPGESFKENINKILSDSKLFALLVTPNLLEEPDGKPNYVMAQEYPAALQSGVDVLPAEMEQTDKEALGEKFKGIPDCVDPHNDQALKKRLMNSIFKIVKTANDNDPTHNFLIGLAYMDGIDVEINREMGLHLITMAANSNLPEAIRMLYGMYSTGKGVCLDYQEASKWALKLSQVCRKEYGLYHPDTIEAGMLLAEIEFVLGAFQESLELNKIIYDACRRIFGKAHKNTITLLDYQVRLYLHLGVYDKALESSKELLMLCQEQLGEEDPLTIASMETMASVQITLGNYPEALETLEKTSALSSKILGQDDAITLNVLNSIASVYSYLGDHKKAIKMLEDLYSRCNEVLGPENPTTLTVLGNLGTCRDSNNDPKKALENLEQDYQQKRKLLGYYHPSTLTTLSNIAKANESLKNYLLAQKIAQIVYDARRKTLGKKHPDTILSLESLSSIYYCRRKYKKALTTEKKAYTLACEVLGEKNPHTITARNNLIYYHQQFGHRSRALALLEKAYYVALERYGEEHNTTLTTVHDLYYEYYRMGQNTKALELLNSTYSHLCASLGEQHPLTLRPLMDLTDLYGKINDTPRALELWQHAYDVRVGELEEDHPDLKWIQKKINQQKNWATVKQGWRDANCCQYCGNRFSRVFKKRCKNCGHPKDY